jgi:hypothetical protein
VPSRSLSPEQVIVKLHHIEVPLPDGKTLPQACEGATITTQSYFRWVGARTFGALLRSQPQGRARQGVLCTALNVRLGADWEARGETALGRAETSAVRDSRLLSRATLRVDPKKPVDFDPS